MKTKLGRSIAVSLALAVGALLMMTAGSIWSLSQAIKSFRMVEHTQDVEAKITTILAQITQYEVVGRSFAVTGNEESLAPYENMKERIDSQLDDLRSLAADNPDQIKRCDELKPLVERKISIISEAVKRMRSKSLTAVDAIRAVDQSLQTVNGILEITDPMIQAENALLTKRRLEAEDKTNQSILAALCTGSLGILSLAFAGMVIVRQLNARASAEARTARVREDLEAILDNAPMSVVLKDTDGRYLLVNRSYAETMGMSKHELLGRTVMDLFPDNEAKEVHARDMQVVRENRLIAAEQHTTLRNGVRRVYLSMRFPVHDDNGKVSQLCSIGVDITERQQMEVALRQARDASDAASRTKSQFLANMSHELRTPLNSIIGFSEILADQLFGPLNAKQQQYNQNILSSGRHLLMLINDLLDLAKIEAGRMRLETESVPVEALVKESIALARGFAERKGVEIVGEIEDVGLVVQLDASKFKQVLNNLLSNAVKFSPARGHVVIKTDKIKQPACPPQGGPLGMKPGFPMAGEWLHVSVSDRGIGIARDDLERIFVEFEQVDTSYSRQQQGTGLGLTLTRRLVGMHGGFVWAESSGRVNDGSTFHVLLPLKGVSTESADTAVLPPHLVKAIDVEQPYPRFFSGHPLVLVVEDDTRARQLITDYLTTSGYEVAFASSGEEALQKATQLQPMAITLDILLPDVNGMDVLARLKSDPATALIPVIIISVTEERELGLSLGAVEFFVKPVNPQKLLEALSNARRLARKPIKRVLMVDDEEHAREAMRATLSSEGFEMILASSGQEALDMAASAPPDLFIVDLMMPGMSGFELVNHLRHNSATRPLPIFVYTAKELSPEERRWLAERAMTIAQKPFKDQLLSELKRLSAASRREILT